MGCWSFEFTSPQAAMPTGTMTNPAKQLLLTIPTTGMLQKPLLQATLRRNFSVSASQGVGSNLPGRRKKPANFNAAQWLTVH